MADLLTKIQLYAKSKNKLVDFGKNVIIQDDSNGKGPYIKEWDLDIKKPTITELDNFEEEGNKTEYNLNIDRIRILQYGDWKQQLDEIYHDIDSWKLRIKKIKSDNPKK